MTKLLVCMAYHKTGNRARPHRSDHTLHTTNHLRKFSTGRYYTALVCLLTFSLLSEFLSADPSLRLRVYPSLTMDPPISLMVASQDFRIHIRLLWHRFCMVRYANRYFETIFAEPEAGIIAPPDHHVRVQYSLISLPLALVCAISIGHVLNNICYRIYGG